MFVIAVMYCCIDEINAILEMRLGGAVASWLLRSTPDQAVRVRLRPGREHHVVFMGKTLDSRSASLHPGV